MVEFEKHRRISMKMQRIEQRNQIAIMQMTSLLKNSSVKKTKVVFTKCGRFPIIIGKRDNLHSITFIFNEY